MRRLLTHVSNCNDGDDNVNGDDGDGHNGDGKDHDEDSG